MKKKFTSKSAFFNPRALIGFGLCPTGLLLGLLAYTSFPGASALAGPATKDKGTINLAGALEVKGTINVAGAKIGGLPPHAVLKCGDLEVVVTSKKVVPHPPLEQQPVWQRHANATGTWASGSCSYTVGKVVANSEFKVVVYYNCHGQQTRLTITPAQAGWFKLARGGMMEQNFTVTSIGCSLIR